MKNKNRFRRSDVKILTKEAAVLKHLRQAAKFSVRGAAKTMGLSEAYVNHAENGRLDLNPKVILQFLNTYGKTYEDFMKLVDGSLPLPSSDFAECVEILKRLTPDKLVTVKMILKSF
jgi:transcriptional regulator with XRE-family HTH domain